MTFARPSPWVYSEEPDTRTDIEKLNDAADRHIEAARKLNELLTPPYSMDSRMSAEFDRLERAYELSKEDFECLLEDICCVPAEKIRRAL